MKRIWLGVIAALALSAGSTAGSQAAAPAKPASPIHWRVQANSITRDTPAFSSSFAQLVVGAERGRWLNPAAGLEYPITDSERRSYFLSETLRWNPKASLTLRLNHLEYPEWEIGANVINLYQSGQSKHWEGSIGLSYSAVIYDPDLYNLPYAFNSEAPELRLIYTWAFRQAFYKQRFGFRLGMFNFTEFENYGYDFDAFVEPYLQINPRVRLRFLYEWRWPPIDIPYLYRTTWTFGIAVSP